MSHHEVHRVHRIGWLRAAVLGANDGIVSTASLIIGVAAAGATQESILLAGVAGLVAGAMSMAAGEYVSVSSQADTERADLELEKISIEHDFEFETVELAHIYEGRGLKPALAMQVGFSIDRGLGDAGNAVARGSCGFFPRLPRNPRWSCGAYGRRIHCYRCDQSDFLGRACDGPDGRRRSIIWCRCLTPGGRSDLTSGDKLTNGRNSPTSD